MKRSWIHADKNKNIASGNIGQCIIAHAESAGATIRIHDGTPNVKSFEQENSGSNTHEVNT